MSYTGVTYTFVNGTKADGGQVNTNFNDLINGLSDGSKDINVDEITCNSLKCSSLVAPSTSAADSYTIAGTDPQLNFKDTDCTDSDNNAYITAIATDTGSGTEDIDVTLYQQIAGTATAFLTSDADGALTIGDSSRGITLDGAVSISTCNDAGLDTDKFLAINASDVVTYRTGAELLSDIGGAAALSGTATYFPMYAAGGTSLEDSDMYYDNATKTLTLESDSALTAGPLFILNHNSASPAINDVVGYLDYRGKNDAAQTQIYSRISTQILSVTDNSEDAAMILSTADAGGVTERGRVTAHGIEAGFNCTRSDGVSWSADQTTAFGIEDTAHIARFGYEDYANGGVLWKLFTKDSSADGVGLHAVAYTEDDLTTHGSLVIDGRKHDGAGALTTVGDTHILFNAKNNNTSKFAILGNGDITTTGAINSCVTVTSGKKLEIDQAGNDDYCLTIASSDVAHGVTTILETDEYFGIKKLAATTGCAQLTGIGTSTRGIFLAGIRGTTNVTDGCVTIAGYEADGTGTAAVAATDSVVEFRNAGTKIAHIEGDGKLYIGGGDYPALYSDGTTGGAGSAGAGNQYVAVTIGGTVYKLLHDGTA